MLRPLSGIPLTAEAQHTIHAPSGCRSDATAGFAWPAGLGGSTTSDGGGPWHCVDPTLCCCAVRGGNYVCLSTVHAPREYHSVRVHCAEMPHCAVVQYVVATRACPLCYLIVPALGTVLSREYHSLCQVPMQCAVCHVVVLCAVVPTLCGAMLWGGALLSLWGCHLGGGWIP